MLRFGHLSSRSYLILSPGKKNHTHHRAHISLLRRARECVAGGRRRVWRGLRRRSSRRRRGRAAPGGLGGGAPGSSHGEYRAPTASPVPSRPGQWRAALAAEGALSERQPWQRQLQEIVEEERRLWVGKHQVVTFKWISCDVAVAVEILGCCNGYLVVDI